ncbi:MAG: hypothetical protein PPP58_10040 [Natronomonas sp.]
MATLESADEDETAVVEIPTPEGKARLSVPDRATDEEVAALIAAVTTRLGGDDAAAETGPDPTDRWLLAGKLDARRRYDLPRECRRGDEWKAAGRRP